MTYRGGCHCGKVTYEVEADLENGKILSCNCSRCRMEGWLLTFVPAAEFKLLSGEDELQDYQFNTKRIHHLFCKTCGIESFACGKGHGGTDTVAVNVRCLDGVSLGTLKVTEVNGKEL